MDLQDKIVILTGASTGIGKGIAEALLAKNAKVIVFGRHRPQNCSSFYKVDVSNERQIIAALSKIEKIDILINNAGIVNDATIENTTNEMLDAMINVNFKGVFWMMKHSIPRLNDGGCIISISSTCGVKGLPFAGVYSATKAAVIRLTESLAQELASRRIRVNTIASGVVDTELWVKRFGDNYKEVLKGVEASTLLKRSAKPEEIAHTVIFLCENDFVDGETIVVDGGEIINYQIL